MYDAIRSYYKEDNRSLFIEEGRRESIVRFGLEFRPSYNSNSQLSCFSATHLGIRIKIRRNKIEFSGGLHTASKGHNGGDFSFTDLLVLLKLLKLKFGDMFMKSTISNLEYGILVQNDEVNWIRYKNVFADKMRDKATGKIYGQKVTLNDFEIKRYDKLLQMTLKNRSFTALPVEGFRIEVKVKRMRSIQTAKNPVRIYKAEDLMLKSNLADMHKHLHSIIRMISMESNLMNDELKYDSNFLHVYGVMNCEKTNSILKKTDKKLHRSYGNILKVTYNKKLREYKKELDIKLDSHLKLNIS